MIKKHGVLGLLLFIVAVVAWFVVVKGQIKSFSENSLAAEAKNAELTSYKDRYSQVDKIVTQGGADASARLDAYFLALPKLPQIPEVLVMIEQMGNSSGLVFNAVGVGTPSNGEVPVTITFGGSLTSIDNFLNTLYTNVRTVRVKSQVLTADKSGTLSVSMQLSLVYQGD
jgi:Tfp pilus assembly protein PilO